MREQAEQEWVRTTKSQQDRVLANANEGGSGSQSGYTQMREQEQVHTTKASKTECWLTQMRGLAGARVGARK